MLELADFTLTFHQERFGASNPAIGDLIATGAVRGPVQHHLTVGVASTQVNALQHHVGNTGRLHSTATGKMLAWVRLERVDSRLSLVVASLVQPPEEK